MTWLFVMIPLISRINLKMLRRMCHSTFHITLFYVVFLTEEASTNIQKTSYAKDSSHRGGGGAKLSVSAHKQKHKNVKTIQSVVFDVAS